jgi:hypothetical protein
MASEMILASANAHTAGLTDALLAADEDGP